MRHLVATLGVKDALPKDYFYKALAVDEFHAVVEDKVRVLEKTHGRADPQKHHGSKNASYLTGKYTTCN